MPLPAPAQHDLEPLDARSLPDDPFPSPPPAAGLDEKLHRRTLRNGLEVLAIRRPGSPVLACRLFIRAGSRFDEGLGGRAHLAEHCMAAGARLEGEPAESVIERLGAELEAGTHREYLHFGISAMPDHLPTALRTLGAICSAPQFGDRQLERQKAVIRHEIRRYQDDIAPLWDRLFAALWRAHPFLPPPVGGEAVFGLGPGDLRRHWAGAIRPDRAVLAVVGELEIGRLADLAEDELGGWRPGERESSLPASPPVPRPRPAWQRISADLQEAYFGLAWPVPPAGSPDDASLELLSRLLTEGPAGILTRKLREQDGELYTIQSALLQYGDSGTLVISGSCDPERLEAVVNKTLELLCGAEKPLVRSAQLAASTLSYPGALARANESAATRAGLLGINGLWGVHLTLAQRLAAVSTVTDEQLEQCRRRYLSRLPALAVLGG